MKLPSKTILVTILMFQIVVFLLMFGVNRIMLSGTSIETAYFPESAEIDTIRCSESYSTIAIVESGNIGIGNGDVTGTLHVYTVDSEVEE